MERDAFANEIRNWLKNSGAVKTLQTKLRKDLIDAISNKPGFVDGKGLDGLKRQRRDAVSSFDGALNLFVIEHLMRQGLWYTASVMASEAEFLQGMQPPDIEEVKVISSLGGEARLNNSNAHPNETRHSAEKLDEVTARLAIKRLLDQGLQSPIKSSSTDEDIDKLFEDYYRNRDKSLLQLVFLLLSKLKSSLKETVSNSKYDNNLHEPEEIKASKNGLRKYQRMRVVDRTGSFETNRIMGPSREIRHLPGGVKNEMSHSTDEGGEYYGTDVIQNGHAPHLSEIGVQTSMKLETPSTLKNDLIKDDGNNKNENQVKVNSNDDKIKSMEDELKDAQAKIKLLEKEKMEIEQRRLVELSSKYVPTSFERHHESLYTDSNLLLNNPSNDGATAGRRNDLFEQPNNSSLDYFISGVRKKVEDLCGRNDALIYPLQQTVKPTPETFGSQKNEEEKTEGDIRSQGATKAFGTQATINLKDSIDKKSHSI